MDTLRYLDNAATSWPKPPGVARAMTACLDKAGANPGRGGHLMARRAADIVFECREALAMLFDLSNPLSIAFMPNATTAINTAIKGMVRPGGHVVTSALEHNAVMRPLHGLEAFGVSRSVIPAPRGRAITPEAVIKELRPNTQLAVLSHVSNVTGAVQPVQEIAHRLRALGIPFLVDAAQSAGCLPLYPEAWGIDLVAFPGHKGLLGPQGTGGLYIREGLSLQPLLEGGTGSDSASLAQPEYMPDQMEPGTLNTPGIAGLKAGVEYLLETGLGEIGRRESLLLDKLMDGIASLPGAEIYGPPPEAPRSGVVSMNLDEQDSESVADWLDREAGVAVRAGLHCAPGAHAALGTLRRGAVRFSVGPFNTSGDVDAALYALERLAPAKMKLPAVVSGR